ncbi:MAG TPA: AAA family ATPase [Thermoanaerobaculia bacterium]|nr:AAA family ATPase [Thermoanaerobaculia bacterium]
MLALLADALEQSGFVPYELVRRERKNGARSGEASVESEVILHETDVRSRSAGRGRHGVPREVARHHTRANIVRIGDIEKVRNSPTASPLMWEHLFNEKSPAFLVVGYGAQRALIGTKDADAFAYQRKRRLVRYQRVAGLFEDQVPLTPLPLWLAPLRRKNPTRGVNVPSGAHSDGDRAYLGWVTDLLNHLVTGCPRTLKLTDVPGVVMVDEVDLHLHPAWQREVIPTLSQIFPRLQFVLTTHSPIVVGTVSSANVYLLEAEPDGTSVPSQLPEAVHGLNAEQILLSSYFNLSTTRAPGFVDEIAAEASSRSAV